MAKKVALLIGVSEYGEGIPSLSAPRNDVAAMKRVLENPNMGGFDEVTIRINPDPTAMRLEVQKIFADRRKDDLVLLFFSGHGITDDNNRLYLATKGTSRDFYKATSVPASFIHDVSLESYAKRQAIILDCCYSGAFAEGWQTKSAGLKLKQELGGEGRVVLTSSTATQTSFQQEGEELSLYTQYLIEGIETGAANKNEDGKIYAHELHEYATAKVQEAKPKQKPGIIIDREGFNIILSQAPVDDPELNFRKLVRKYASKGEISSYRREILKIKQQQFHLTEEKADEIINSVLEPFRQHLVNLEQYREEYRKQVDKQYPLDKTLVQDLKDWGRQVLGLQDEDIAQIEQDINAKKEAEYQNKLKQYKQKFSKAVEQEYPLSNSARNQINILQQSLGIRTEDIKRIEQPILAAKYQKKLKEKERQGQHGQISTSQPSVPPVATPNATSTSSSSSTQYQSSTPQPKSQTSSSTTTPAETHSTPPSSPQKTRILVGGGIAVALALVLTFSFLDKTPQPEQNGETVSKSESLTTSQMTADDFLNRGWDKFNKGDNQGAIEDYTQSLELKPYDSLAYNNRGLAHSNLGDNQEAIEDYTQAIKINQNWESDSESYFGLPTAYFNRGLARSDLGDNLGAIEDYTKAIELNPNYAEAYNNRGLLYGNLGDYQKAIADFTESIKLKNPELWLPYNNRGLAHSNLRDYQKAIADSTKAIKLNSDYADAYYDRGFAYEQQGDNQAAIYDYQKAADLYKQQGNTKWYQNALNNIKELQ